jgi:iron complex outermembrane receptor protein
MIQGKVAVYKLQMVVGEGATIRIRSGSSLSANNDPSLCYRWCAVAAGGISGGEKPFNYNSVTK